MRERIFQWLDHEFITLSAEGHTGKAEDQAKEAFGQLEDRLRARGLSLGNTVRTRLWGRDRESRDLGSKVRSSTLTGPARSVSSSYISPDHFESPAGLVAVDLLAMFPSQQGAEKRLVEYEPPIVPLRYLVCGSICFLSGVTSEKGDLADQVSTIVPAIESSLIHAGTSWDRVARIAAFLHTSQEVAHFKTLLNSRVKAPNAQLAFGPSDGYSTPGKLVEVEVTARA